MERGITGWLVRASGLRKLRGQTLLKIGLAIVLSFVAMAIVCGPRRAEQYGRFSGIPPYNPQKATMISFTWHIFRHTTKTLVGMEPGTNKIVPSIAESWEVSADGLVYTFHIRPGVVFWDGHRAMVML